MDRAYAIECKCSHRGERFQLAFARKAAQLLPQHEETAFESSGAGLTLLAETELSLERPLERLRAVYGNELQIAPPIIRYRRAQPIEEPHMGLRVLCAPSHFESFQRDLLARAARIIDSESNDKFGVLRASAPLAVLVGYPAYVKQLSHGRAQLAMWLSHYAPVEPPPGGAAA